MLNAADAAVVSPVAAADSVYPMPALLMDRPGNVATPATAATVVVPDSVPPPGFDAIESETLPVKLVATRLFASFAVTTTDGVIDVACTELTG